MSRRENGVKTAGRESFHGSENTICSEGKACRKAKQKRRNETAAKDEGHDRYDRMDANSSWWVSELLAVDCT